MLEHANPAWAAFSRAAGNELVFGQVLVRRDGPGWELRHVTDRAAAGATLRELDPAAARQWAQHTAAGAFRPLKSSPDLAPGWRLRAASAAELGEALDRLYPGAVADWFAVTQASPVITHYREFTARQTGMYRLTATLDDGQAAEVARACCHRDVCLKRRLWTVPGLPPDNAAEKSAIPCLEPCALLLELARTAARLTKDNAAPAPTGQAEAAARLREVETALARPDASVRAADFASPENPRRLRWLREKLARAAGGAERLAP